MTIPKVLVADDSPLVLRMIEKMLTGAGYGVVTATDGLEAVEKAATDEDVCLVILDVMMPRMNGYQACRLLKTEPATRGIPVVILTSKDQAGDRFWGLETGADYYVTKDSAPHRIIELVRGIVGGGEHRRKRQTDAQRSGIDILSRVNELLDRKLYEATILSEIGRVARSLVQFDETFTSVMGIVGRVVEYAVGSMAFVEDDDVEMVLLVNRRVDESVVEDVRARMLQAVVAGRNGVPPGRVQSRLFSPAGQTAVNEDGPLGGFAAFPVVTNQRLAGLLALGGRNVARMGRDTELFLAQVANQAQIVTENSRLFERVRDLSVRDGLTDLFNHRHTVELLNLEVERVGRYQEQFSVLMIDIDHFKAVNDRFGHPVGDQVLREVAALLADTLRTVDVVGRYGGEEFMAILPHTRYEDARATAERLRERVEGHAFGGAATPLRVTVSVGVASFPSDGVDSAGALTGAADRALYQAKDEGRNRVA